MYERQPTPLARLQAFLDSVIESRKNITRYGYPLGSLSQEMNESHSSCRARVNNGLTVRAQCIAEQFRALGRSHAWDPGTWVIGSVQGAILMANAMDDPAVIERQIEQLKAWIDSL
ncbi:MAG: hypothetical protein GTO41_19005 [Burkholderiales bacterium]|nr:hypothetical protein [Burkholderiales bacterium]